MLRTNGMPHRYYARQMGGILLIVLDANNEPDSEAPAPGHDAAQGADRVGNREEACMADPGIGAE